MTRAVPAAGKTFDKTFVHCGFVKLGTAFCRSFGKKR